MAERILFLTGHLARPRLEKILVEIGDLGFEWSVLDIGVKVAALMTEAIIMRRLPRPLDASRVMVPVAAGPISSGLPPNLACRSFAAPTN